MGVFLGIIALIAVGAGCDNRLTDEEIDRIVDATLSHASYQQELNDNEIDRWVGALMAHPSYLEFLDDDALAEEMVDALMGNPAYQGLLSTTPEEDCVALIVMAAALSGDFTPPAEGRVDELCAWYASQVP